MCQLKKYIFVCASIKSIKSIIKHTKKCEIGIITEGKYFWFNRRDLKIE